jgi:hypothetical protein
MQPDAVRLESLTYATGVPISRIKNFMSSHASFFAAGFRNKYAG